MRGLADAAIDRVLLTGERVTSAAEGRGLLAGEAETEALADNIQRVVVLAVPVIRTVARGSTVHEGAVGDGRIDDESRSGSRFGPACGSCR